jgi:hypothetical protein
MDPFTEKGEAGASIGPIGSTRADVLTQLKETGDGVMVPASKEERNSKGTSVSSVHGYYFIIFGEIWCL